MREGVVYLPARCSLGESPGALVISGKAVLL